jgi:hypothetical protein
MAKIKRATFRQGLIFAASACTFALSVNALAVVGRCEDTHKNGHLRHAREGQASFKEIVAVMEKNPYNLDQLPVIPLQMFKWIGKKLTYFVAQRSREILVDKRDYREVGMEKPIHPMGVGLTGQLVMTKSRWSGIFRGGQFLIAARASISQGVPFKYDSNGKMQVRSTAMAIKIFNTTDDGQSVKTANAVFQNNLNGLLGRDGKPLNFLESAQTNQPGIDFSKVKMGYQIETLLGVAYGSIANRKDHMSKVPFINPQIRPVHSWSELGENDPRNVKTPTWVKIVPKTTGPIVDENDFRIEIAKTLSRDGVIEYELFAADQQDSKGGIQWEKVGNITFTRSILSEGVDKYLLFPHDTLNSNYTGQKFEIPAPSKQMDTVPDDIQ